MEDRTGDAVATVDLRSGEERPETSPPVRQPSAFDPPAQRFEAVGELGRGGMGRVDDAFDRALGRPVAIKHMLSTSEVELARFEREARITARLEHPGIVPIHDAGRGPDGTPYYVMRRVDGKPLDLAIGKTLAERLATIPNVLAACDAVGFAHARGIVHRDIKPTNILVGPFGETLVIDWGLAREIGESDAAATILPSDPQLTRAGTVAGTPGFMAPEQARGEAVDARADVFALGATLYFVLAGRLPYDTASATEMVGLAGEGRAPNWRAIPDDVPPELRAITMKAMASDPAARYPDAGALAADLRQFITGNLVAAYDYSPLARFVRFVRRHRAAVAVAAVSALIVLAIGIVAFRRIVAERDDAKAARALAEATNDRLLVQHALELADTDPIATIAALRTLKPDSVHWRDARVAAAAAFVRGIPFGFVGRQEEAYIQIQRDSRLAAIVSFHTGDIAVIDLIARTYRFITSFHEPPFGMAWLGTEHLVVGLEHDVAVVDIVHGTTRKLGIPAAHVHGDHGTVVWIDTPDHRLFELADPAGSPRELASEVVAAIPSRDYRNAIVQHGTTVEIWTPTTQKLRLFDGARDQVIGAIDEHHVIVLDETGIRTWKLEHDTLVPIARVPGLFTSVDVVAGKFLVSSAEGLSFLFGDQLVRIGPVNGAVFSTPRGGIQVGTDGAALLIDDRGLFHLGRRDAGLRRADVSADGRFVLATTDAGNVLAWDLERLYPRRITGRRTREFVRMSDRWLWTENTSEGLSRIDLATGREEELPEVIITRAAEIDPGERWAMLATGTHFQIFDLVERGIRELEAADGSLDETGVVLLHADGSLWQWHPKATELQRIGTVPPPTRNLSALGSRAGLITVVYPDRILRLNVATQRSTIAPLAGVAHHGIASDGTVWMRQDDGTVWRWPVDGDPVRVDLPQPPMAMALMGEDILFYTHEAVALQRGTKRHVVAVASSAFNWDGGSTITTVSAQGVPSILDMETELSYRLPVTGMTQIAGHGQRIATGNSAETLLWNIDVPEDPRELQAWLQTVTNVKTIPGSEAYAWP